MKRIIFTAAAICFFIFWGAENVKATPTRYELTLLNKYQSNGDPYRINFIVDFENSGKGYNEVNQVQWDLTNPNTPYYYSYLSRINEKAFGPDWRNYSNSTDTVGYDYNYGVYNKGQGDDFRIEWFQDFNNVVMIDFQESSNSNKLDLTKYKWLYYNEEIDGAFNGTWAGPGSFLLVDAPLSSSSPIPEPTTFILLATGLIVFCFNTHKQRVR